MHKIIWLITIISYTEMHVFLSAFESIKTIFNMYSGLLKITDMHFSTLDI